MCMLTLTRQPCLDPRTSESLVNTLVQFMHQETEHRGSDPARQRPYFSGTLLYCFGLNQTLDIGETPLCGSVYVCTSPARPCRRAFSIVFTETFLPTQWVKKNWKGPSISRACLWLCPEQKGEQALYFTASQSDLSLRFLGTLTLKCQSPHFCLIICFCFHTQVPEKGLDISFHFQLANSLLTGRKEAEEGRATGFSSVSLSFEICMETSYLLMTCFGIHSPKLTSEHKPLITSQQFPFCFTSL